MYLNFSIKGSLSRTGVMASPLKASPIIIIEVDIGPGIHIVREDNPHLIGSELALWHKGIS